MDCNVIFDENAIEDIRECDKKASKDTIINAIETQFIK